MSRDPLLRAVLDRPEDDAARLAYADAIARRSAARAELIRAQVALARPSRLDAAQCRRLRRRVKELLAAHGSRWRAAVPALDGITWGYTFSRGFLDSCTAQDLAAFQAHAAAIRAITPLVRLRFERLGAADLPALLRLPDLAGIRRLVLAGYAAPGDPFGDAEAWQIASCPHLARLRELILHDHAIGDDGVRALAASLHLGQLCLLDLIQNRVGPEGVRALAHSRRLRSLRHLDLHGNNHKDDCLADLASSPLAGRLRSLGAGGSFNVTIETARALAESPALTQLRTLELNNTRIGDAGLMYLAHSPHLVRLRELCLRETGIGDGGLAVLLRSPLAARLRTLDIESTDITELSAWELVRSPVAQRLRLLKLWDCDNLQGPVCRALRGRFGKRVEVHASGERRKALASAGSASPAGRFLEEIRSRPEDDAPRLVYADWLEEKDEPQRAEFIRLQCRRAPLRPRAAGQAKLAQREKELLIEYGQRWVEEAFLHWLEHAEADCPLPHPHDVCRMLARATPLRMQLARSRRRKDLQKQLDRLAAQLEKFQLVSSRAAGPLFADFRFQRGMIEQVTIDEAMFFDFTPAVRDLGVIRHLKIIHDDQDLEIGDELVRRLIACMDTPRLLSLELGTQVLELETIEALAAWPGTAELTTLTGLRVGQVSGDLVLRVLARSPYLKRLGRLSLSLGAGYTDTGVFALADSANLPELKQVHLHGNARLSERGLAMLRERFGG